MSVRILYRTIPVSKRTCNYYRCQERIQRNIAQDKNGHLYHYGCLLDAQEERYQCLECNLNFDATEAGFEEITDSRQGEFRERSRVLCPNCSCRNLRRN